MTYSLLVWEIIPEDTEFYLIPNEVLDSNEYRQYLEQAHFTYINVDEYNEGLKFLNTALASKKDGIAEEGFEEYLGCFTQYKKDNDKPLKSIITTVYLSGFNL